MGAKKGRVPWNKGKKRKCPWMLKRNKKYKNDKIKLVKICLICNKEFIVPFCRKNAKYCSKLCHNESMVIEESENHNKVIYNKLADELPPYCNLCKSIDKLIIHHIDGNHRNSVLSNLMVLCKGCHNKVHRRRR